MDFRIFAPHLGSCLLAIAIASTYPNRAAADEAPSGTPDKSAYRLKEDREGFFPPDFIAKIKEGLQLTSLKLEAVSSTSEKLDGTIGYQAEFLYSSSRTENFLWQASIDLFAIPYDQDRQPREVYSHATTIASNVVGEQSFASMTGGDQLPPDSYGGWVTFIVVARLLPEGRTRLLTHQTRYVPLLPEIPKGVATDEAPSGTPDKPAEPVNEDSAVDQTAQEDHKGFFPPNFIAKTKEGLQLTSLEIKGVPSTSERRTGPLHYRAEFVYASNRAEHFRWQAPLEIFLIPYDQNRQPGEVYSPRPVLVGGGAGEQFPASVSGTFGLPAMSYGGWVTAIFVVRDSPEGRARLLTHQTRYVPLLPAKQDTDESLELHRRTMPLDMNGPPRTSNGEAKRKKHEALPP